VFPAASVHTDSFLPAFGITMGEFATFDALAPTQRRSGGTGRAAASGAAAGAGTGRGGHIPGAGLSAVSELHDFASPASSGGICAFSGSIDSSLGSFGSIGSIGSIGTGPTETKRTTRASM
jgi:hypothetical protein